MFCSLRRSGSWCYGPPSAKGPRQPMTFATREAAQVAITRVVSVLKARRPRSGRRIHHRGIQVSLLYNNPRPCRDPGERRRFGPVGPRDRKRQPGRRSGSSRTSAVRSEAMGSGALAVSPHALWLGVRFHENEPGNVLAFLSRPPIKPPPPQWPEKDRFRTGTAAHGISEGLQGSRVAPPFGPPSALRALQWEDFRRQLVSGGFPARAPPHVAAYERRDGEAPGLGERQASRRARASSCGWSGVRFVAASPAYVYAYTARLRMSMHRPTARAPA